MRRLPTVAVSMGDPFGIGPEVLVAALSRRSLRERAHWLVFGDRSVLERAASVRRLRVPKAIEVVSSSALAQGRFRFGHPSRASGRYSIAYLEAAVEAVRSGRAEALCTGPVHKASMVKAGFGYAGHTDFLRDRFEATRVVMMLAGPRLRVALATVHIPLSEVSRSLTRQGLVEILAILDSDLRRLFGIRRPRVGVTGVNPHAGEDGLLGSEEKRIIAPAIQQARRKGIAASGPFPADSLFARQIRAAEFDVILAMAHDQGLGPLKAVDFERAVNVTLGLPRPRTSPDHGVAFDIAGRGVADPSSMSEALALAAELSRSAR
jgi:4-hydroxythreonine-4-phosphate dehydrogenase